MVSIQDQFTAVLNAPIPFGLALIAFWFAIWRAMVWRYGGIIDLWKTMHQLATTEAVAAKAKQIELEATVKSLTADASKLQKEAEGNAKLKPLILDLSTSASTASAQLAELRTANNAVSAALSRAPTGIFRFGGEQVGPVFVPEDHKPKNKENQKFELK